MRPAVLDLHAPVFVALADPQRRMLLNRLLHGGEATASRLSTGMPISRQAVVKHLTTLHRAHLVSSRRSGRDVLFTAEPGQLLATGAALQQVGAVWERTLADLKQLAEMPE